MVDTKEILKAKEDLTTKIKTLLKDSKESNDSEDIADHFTVNFLKSDPKLQPLIEKFTTVCQQSMASLPLNDMLSALTKFFGLDGNDKKDFTRNLKVTLATKPVPPPLASKPRYLEIIQKRLFEKMDYPDAVNELSKTDFFEKVLEPLHKSKNITEDAVDDMVAQVGCSTDEHRQMIKDMIYGVFLKR